MFVGQCQDLVRLVRNRFPLPVVQCSMEGEAGGGASKETSPLDSEGG